MVDCSVPLPAHSSRLAPTRCRAVRFMIGVYVIETNLAKSSSPIDNSTACRHAVMICDPDAVMICDPVQRIKRQGTRHHDPDESPANDQFHGIDELVPARRSSPSIRTMEG